MTNFSLPAQANSIPTQSSSIHDQQSSHQATQAIPQKAPSPEEEEKKVPVETPELSANLALHMQNMA